MKNKELSEAYIQKKELKYKFRFYQIDMQNVKDRYWDPYDYPDLDERTWEMNKQYEIDSISYILKTLEKEIRDLNKNIKKMNREQNEKYNISQHSG